MFDDEGGGPMDRSDLASVRKKRFGSDANLPNQTVQAPFFLVVVETGEMILIARPILVLGRALEEDSTSTLLDLESESVSSRHSLIASNRMNSFIMDLGSEGGTFLNGRKIHEPTVLHYRDVIRVGDVCLSFKPIRR